MIKKFKDKFSNRTNFVVFQLAFKLLPMVIRGSLLRVWFKKSDYRTFISPKATIRNPQYITAGQNFLVEDYAEIQGVSEKGITFGDNVSVGAFSMIRPSAYYARPIGVGLKVGNNSNIGPYAFIGCSGWIEIGDNVMMGPRVNLHSENHIFSDIDIPMKVQGVNREFVIIEDDCWLASNCIIMPGVTVRKGSIVASGAVVTKDTPAYSIVAGVPAKIIGYRK